MGKKVTIACGGCGLRIERVIQHESEARWMCPDCDPAEGIAYVRASDADDAPQCQLPGLGANMSVLRNGKGLPDGFQEVNPRGTYENREYPRAIMDDVQWNQLVTRLRIVEGGERILCILYWYYRAGMSAREIAGELHCTVKSVRRVLERAKESL